MKQRLLFLLPAFLLMLAACKVSDSPTGMVDSNGNLSTTIAGVINDEGGKPVPDVSVAVNGRTVTTNKYGMFIIQNASIPASRCFILCKKKGYFTGCRAVIPKIGSITEFRLVMQSSSASNLYFEAASGGKITIGEASVFFSPASIITSSGQLYKGTVHIAAKFLDPSQNSFYDSFSGDMNGERLDGTLTELLSYGVLRVQITDGAGNELKLAAGKTAKLSYPISIQMRKDAPATMPLWYFDENIGMWKEEGEAKKSELSYIGEVSHFTDWNCDFPTNTGIVKGRVTCETSGIENIYVTIGQRKVLTDKDGFFTCRVPANTNLSTFINPKENGGFTATDVSISLLNVLEERTINIQISNCPGYVSGTIVDCEGNPIPGAIQISNSKGNNCIFTTSGDFTVKLLPDVQFSVEAVAFDGTPADIIFINKLAPSEKRSLGQLYACGNGNKSEFYDIKIDQRFAGIVYPILTGDGSMVAICGKNKTGLGCIVAVYNTKTGTKLSEFTKDTSASAIKFSDDGTKLLINWSNGDAELLNPSTGSVLQKFSNLYSAFLLPDGTGMIARGYNDSLKTYIYYLYSISGGAMTKAIPNFMGIRGSTDLLIGGSYEEGGDGRTDYKRWNGTMVNTISYYNFITNSPASGFFSYNNCIVAYSSDYSISYYSKTLNSMPSYPNGYSFSGFYNSLTGASYSSSNRPTLIANDYTYLIAGGTTPFQPPVTYNISDGKVLKILPVLSKSAVYSDFFYSSNSQYLAATQNEQSNYSVRIWKVK